MFCSLRDNLVHNEMFLNMPPQILNQIKALFYLGHKKENIEKDDNGESPEEWDSTMMRCLVCTIGQDLCDGRECTIDGLQQKSKVNLRRNLCATPNLLGQPVAADSGLGVLAND